MNKLLIIILAIIILVATSISVSANWAHSQITGMSYTEKKSFFEVYLSQSGISCYSVTKIFFKGLGKGVDNENYAYWAIRCRDGQAYMIQIRDDKEGSTSILECEILKMIGLDCFKKFSDQ